MQETPTGNDETASINGWKPPIMYDVMTDQHRIVTQEDVREMQQAKLAIRLFLQGVKKAVKDFETATGGSRNV